MSRAGVCAVERRRPPPGGADFLEGWLGGHRRPQRDLAVAFGVSLARNSTATISGLEWGVQDRSIMEKKFSSDELPLAELLGRGRARRTATAGLPARLGVGRRAHPEPAGVRFSAVVPDRRGHDAGRGQSRRELQGAAARRRDAGRHTGARDAPARRPAAADVAVSGLEDARFRSARGDSRGNELLRQLLRLHRSLHRPAGGPGGGGYRRVPAIASCGATSAAGSTWI